MKKFNPTQVSEIKISYSPKFPARLRPSITCSQNAVEILRQSWEPGQINYVESFKVLLLNRAHKVLGISTVSKGGVSGTLADPKVIFGTALKALASAIIVSHNHPSSNTKPSQADINLTKKLVEGGNLLDIKVLDHIIITEDQSFSFLDEGLI